MNNTYNITYILLKIYDFLLTFYIILMNKFNIYYNLIYKKFYTPTNLIYIFDNDTLIIKENFNNNFKIKELINNTNNNYFIIHNFQHLDINYISNNYILNNINLIKPKFTFILVEISSNNQKFDITNFLNNKNTSYYIVNNVLFDKQFMYWLKYNKFNIDINNYTINIIDNDINNIKLLSNKCIKLHHSSYSIEEI